MNFKVALTIIITVMMVGAIVAMGNVVTDSLSYDPVIERRLTVENITWESDVNIGVLSEQTSTAGDSTTTGVGAGIGAGTVINEKVGVGGGVGAGTSHTNYNENKETIHTLRQTRKVTNKGESWRRNHICLSFNECNRI